MAPDELFVTLAERAQAQYGFRIDPHHFSILGRCRNCQ
jgi:Fe2+ or Zn2+ uptake regulation protein